VRAYLAQFLSDRRVVELPRALWLPVLHGIILSVRPRRSARLYRRIWSEAGSPLVATMLRLAPALQTHLENRLLGGCRVAAGMRYGAPSIAAGLRSLRDAGCDELLILPLFPQYSSTTTASMFDAVFAELSTWRRVLRLRLIDGYHDHPAYIHAVAHTLRTAWIKDGLPGRLLFSFHSIPCSYVARGDPYEAQCHRTAALIADALGLPAEAWQVAFQSRFGPHAWLSPSTVDALLALARAATGRLDVIAPGFAVDCLETLDEIANEARQEYLQAGGSELHYIPALNDGEGQVEMLARLVLAEIGAQMYDIEG
jgi:ferrochelatase